MDDIWYIYLLIFAYISTIYRKYVAHSIHKENLLGHGSSSEDDSAYLLDFPQTHNSRTALSFPEDEAEFDAQISSDDPQTRRELAYRAAQRRIRERNSWTPVLDVVWGKL